MANQEPPDSMRINVRLKRDLVDRIKHESCERGMGFSEMVRHFLSEGVKDVVLTYDEIKKVAQEVRDAEIKQRYK